MCKSHLEKYNNSWYSPGAGCTKQILWYYINAILFSSPLFPFSKFKIKILRLFGAKIGKNIVIKPSVSIKYPWKLSIGDYTWIGEHVWIDNLAQVTIGSHVCISQGSMILCGNHDYKSQTFDLIVKPVTLEDGVWIGAKSVVCPGITIKTHSVLSVGSVASTETDPYCIHRGNPAINMKKRIIK